MFAPYQERLISMKAFIKNAARERAFMKGYSRHQQSKLSKRRNALSKKLDWLVREGTNTTKPTRIILKREESRIEQARTQSIDASCRNFARASHVAYALCRGRGFFSIEGGVLKDSVSLSDATPSEILAITLPDFRRVVEFAYDFGFEIDTQSQALPLQLVNDSLHQLQQVIVSGVEYDLGLEKVFLGIIDVLRNITVVLVEEEQGVIRWGSGEPSASSEMESSARASVDRVMSKHAAEVEIEARLEDMYNDIAEGLVGASPVTASP